MKKIKNLFRKLREKVAVIGTTAMGTLILAETRVFAAKLFVNPIIPAFDAE